MDKISILYTLINIIIMLILISIVYLCKRKNVSFTKRVFIALAIGIVFGMTIQYFYGTNSEITNETINWISILGDGYVRLLKMIIIPLIITSIISAIIKLTNSKDVGKMSLLVILTLVFTAGIAAIIGILTALALGLTAEGLQAGTIEILQSEKLQKGLEILNQTTITKKITDLIPQNIFEDFAGLRKNSTIGVVIFSAIIGIAALKTSIKKPESIEFLKNNINTPRHNIRCSNFNFKTNALCYISFNDKNYSNQRNQKHNKAWRICNCFLHCHRSYISYAYDINCNK